MDLRFPQGNVNYLKQIYNIWVMKYLLKQNNMCATFEKLIRGYTENASPTTVKGCRSFIVMVNFLSMFCPELQK